MCGLNLKLKCTPSKIRRNCAGEGVNLKGCCWLCRKSVFQQGDYYIIIVIIVVSGVVSLSSLETTSVRDDNKVKEVPGYCFEGWIKIFSFTLCFFGFCPFWPAPSNTRCLYVKIQKD